MQATPLSIALELSSLPLIQKTKMGYPQDKTPSAELVTCPEQESLLVLVVPHSSFPTTEGAVEIPVQTKFSSQLHEISQ